MQDDLMTISNDLTLDDGDNLIAIANRAELMVQAIKKIKIIVLQITNTDDWIDQSGKPYLQVSGAQKIRPVFGIEWEISKDPMITEDDDGHRTYKFTGVFTMGNKTVTFIGGRSSRDPFFSRTKGSDRPIEEINMLNVEKAAYTNTIGCGITGILGIRNMQWEELGLAGISKEKTTSIHRSGVPVAPKFGEFAGKPLTEVSDKWLRRYAEIIKQTLDFGEKIVIPVDATKEEKAKAKPHNDAIDKKNKFRTSNMKLMAALEDEAERRDLQKVVVESEPQQSQSDPTNQSLDMELAEDERGT